MFFGICAFTNIDISCSFILAANAEKHANNIKLRDYLKSEQVRYREELVELEILIAQAEGREPITTVETVVETKLNNNDDDDSDFDDEE